MSQTVAARWRLCRAYVDYTTSLGILRWVLLVTTSPSLVQY